MSFAKAAMIVISSMGGSIKELDSDLGVIGFAYGMSKVSETFCTIYTLCFLLDRCQYGCEMLEC